MGVVKVQGEKLDVQYLNRMADELGVRELLEIVLSDH